MTMKKLPAIALLTTALVAGLSGCVTANPDVVHPYQAQRMATVIDATVLSVRPVNIDGQQSGGGAMAGGVIGAVAGSNVGGYRDGAVASVIGAVAGAMIGNAVERNATKENGVEIIVQLRNGERRQIIQGIGSEPPLAVGDPVILVTNSGRTVVRHAPLAPPPPPPADRRG
ncbi:glycine zipper 2TM domain-containing protein [Burkholderiaceae bacterium UC74_6]